LAKSIKAYLTILFLGASEPSRPATPLATGPPAVARVAAAQGLDLRSTRAPKGLGMFIAWRATWRFLKMSKTWTGYSLLCLGLILALVAFGCDRNSGGGGGGDDTGTSDTGTDGDADSDADSDSDSDADGDSDSDADSDADGGDEDGGPLPDGDVEDGGDGGGGDADTAECTGATLAEVRTAATGADHAAVDLDMCPAVVTYLQSTGYFVQAGATGPGIQVYEGFEWVADVALGDEVSLHVTELHEYNGNQEITAHDAVVVIRSGVELAPLTQALTADGPSEETEAELVTVAGVTITAIDDQNLTVDYGTVTGAIVRVADASALCVGGTFNVRGVVTQWSPDSLHRVQSFDSSDITGLSGCGSASSTLGEITAGCDAWVADVYSLAAADGELVEIMADTVADGTASDLYAVLFSDIADPETSFLEEGDDDFECSFVPPSASCPDFSFTVDSSSAGTLYVAVGNYGDCADDSLTEYELFVTVAGSVPTLTLVEDDWADWGTYY